MSKSDLETPPWLRRLAKLVAGSTLFLIFAGAMVTSTGSGLAVPDWPLSYGMLFPPMVGGIFYEHGHRMIAASVGFLTIIQAVWLQLREPKTFVRRLGWIALGAVVLQGLLGGLTVIFLLPTAISVSHAALAELFLCLCFSIAFFTSRFYSQTDFGSLRSNGSLVGISRLLVVAVFIQMLIGAVMRHLSAGLAIPDFPLSFGRLVPSFSSLAITVNYLHRVGAIVVLVLMTVAALRIMKTGSPLARKLGIFLCALTALQITLGAYTVWSGKNPLITSFHVVTGASILATSVLFALVATTARDSGVSGENATATSVEVAA